MTHIIATLLFAASIASLNSATAQNSQDSVKKTIIQLFIAMKNADAKDMESCFADSAVLQTIIQNECKTSIRNEKVNEFSSFVAKLQMGDADEQVAFDVVKVDNELAIV